MTVNGVVSRELDDVDAALEKVQIAANSLREARKTGNVEIARKRLHSAADQLKCSVQSPHDISINILSHVS